MPKRMLDDSYLNSPSLDRCSPRAQDAFPRFILMADDFGCFEADPRRLVALGWSSKRSDVSPADVWAWLEEYVAAGMACLWTEKERRWCFLTGWFGVHGQRRRAEYDPQAPRGTPGAHGSKRRTPPPPGDLVAAVTAGERRDHDGLPPGVDREIRGSADFPQFPAREEKETIPNNSVPAREFAGNAREFGGSAAEIRGSAAPAAAAVPVAVPGAAGNPAGAAAGYPTPADRLARYPALSLLVSALDDAGLTRPLPKPSTVLGALDQLAVRFGVPPLVADVRDHPEGNTLNWFAVRWAGDDFVPPDPRPQRDPGEPIVTRVVGGVEYHA